ncbi:MAG: hypothetical protein IPH13_12015 [Planctomycetes bacterium]|nr:hypothetical protein [Planctomycetota bacterium]
MLRRTWTRLVSLFAGRENARAPGAQWRTVLEADIPTLLQKDTLYLAGDRGEFWFAAMHCPCHCGDVIHLSLLKSDTPSWSVTLGDLGEATLRPSIWRRQGCKSHFWFVNGRAEFVREKKRDGPFRHG